MTRLYRPEIFTKFPEVAAVFTERDPSRPDNFSFRMTSSDLDQNTVTLFELLDFEGIVVRPTQIHSADIAVITNLDQLQTIESKYTKKPLEFDGKVDGVITNLPGVMVGITVADCTGNLIYDPVKNVVASLHAGWKGATAGIIRTGLEILKSQFGSNPADLVVYISPSATQPNYEFGPEAINLFDAKYRKPGRANRWLVDVSGLVHDQFLETGVLPENIELDPRDTITQNDIFFSARSDHETTETPTGRMLVGIAIRT